MTEFGRDLQKLMRVVERETDATSDDRARMRKRLATRLGSAAIAASTTGSVSAYASRGAMIKLGAWLAKGAKIATVLHGVPLALAIGAAASVPLVRGVGRSSSGDTAATVHATEPQATLLPEVEPSPPAPKLDREPEEIPLVAPRPPARQRGAPRVSASATPDPVKTSAGTAPNGMPRSDGATVSLLEEYTLISRMHRALGARDQGQLSGAIDEHGRRFASGVLTEEREAMRAMLGCMRSSTSEEARSIVSTFLARYPRSLHASRVEASCGDRSP